MKLFHWPYGFTQCYLPPTQVNTLHQYVKYEILWPAWRECTMEKKNQKSKPACIGLPE